jgi:uncharacterized protein involved in outer membrane biogenesis
MRRLRKILIILAAVIVILSVIGYLVIRSYLTPERVRRIAEQIATQALQHPVDIGETDLNIGFRISISIKDVGIANPERFRPGPMVSIDRTALNIKLLPLLGRKIVIGSIDFSKAVLHLEKNRDGELNIVALIPKEMKGPGWNVSLSKIRFRNSECSYYDAVTTAEYRVFDINQDVDFHRHRISITGSQRISIPENKMLPKLDVDIHNAVTYDTLTKDISIGNLRAHLHALLLRISGAIEKGELLNLAGELSISDMSKLKDLMPKQYRMEKMAGTLKSDFSVAGTTKDPKIEGTCSMDGIVLMAKDMKRAVENINGTLSFDRASVRDLDIRGNLGTTKFNIKGAVTALDTREPVLNITAAVDGDLKDFESLTTGMQDIRLRGGISSNVALKGTMRNPRYSGDINIRDAEIDGIGLGKPLSNLNIKGSMQNDALRITECRGHIGRSDLALTGSVTNFKKPVVQLDNRSKLIDLDEIMPKKEPGKSPGGKGAGITIHGSVAIAKLIGMNMEFTNVNTNFSYVDGIIDLKNCRANTYDGQVTFDFYYNANSPEPYRINTQMTSIQAQKVMQRFLKFDGLKGDLSGAVNMSGNGLDQRSVRSNMTGSGNVRVVNGEFNNFDFLVKLFSWMGVQGQNTVRFSDFNSGFRITNGRATLDDWTMSSQAGDFLTRGSIGLNGTLDMQIAITLAPQYSEKVKRYHGDWIFFTDKDGRTVIDVLATGKFDVPQFRLDSERIKQRIGGKIKSEFKEKTKDFETKLKDLLKGIR